MIGPISKLGSKLGYMSSKDISGSPTDKRNVWVIWNGGKWKRLNETYISIDCYEQKCKYSEVYVHKGSKNSQKSNPRSCFEI